MKHVSAGTKANRSAMNILVVFCHPREKSFSAAVRDQFVAGARASGHLCEIADLYREGFNPIMSERDMQQFDGVRMPDDVLREQERINRADALCFVFPIWWYGMPAMLKGWLDRVWSAGWAYEWKQNPQGSLLKKRPCSFLLPIGSDEGVMSKWGYDREIDHLWRYGVLGYCGVSPVNIHFLLNSDGFDSSPFKKHLEFSYEVGLNFENQSGDKSALISRASIENV